LSAKKKKKNQARRSVCGQPVVEHPDPPEAVAEKAHQPAAQPAFTPGAGSPFATKFRRQTGPAANTGAHQRAPGYRVRHGVSQLVSAWEVMGRVLPEIEVAIVGWGMCKSQARSTRGEWPAMIEVLMSPERAEAGGAGTQAHAVRGVAGLF